MAVQWNAPPERETGLIADRSLYLDKSGTRLVLENSIESASLLVARGHEIDPADVARLRLVIVAGEVQQESEEPANEAPAEEEISSDPVSHGESEG